MTQRHTRNPQTGPKTQEGKKRSSLNALKHGFDARAAHALAAVDDACDIEFQPYLDKVRAHYQPSDPMEEELVERIARCLWRLARSADMERRLVAGIGARTNPSNSNERILKFERLVDMQLHRAIRTLDRKRARRPGGRGARRPQPSTDN